MNNRDDTSDLIAQLVARRNELGMSQQQLAEKTGLKQAAIARLESNGVIPRIDTFVKTAKSLGLEIRLVAMQT